MRCGPGASHGMIGQAARAAHANQNPEETPWTIAIRMAERVDRC